MVKIPKLIFAAAAFAAAMGLNIPAGHAAAWRENPWCAVIDYGDGGVTWECNYRTFEECYPNVLAGNKGSCNLNPAGPGPQAATPAAHAQETPRAALARRRTFKPTVTLDGARTMAHTSADSRGHERG